MHKTIAIYILLFSTNVFADDFSALVINVHDGDTIKYNFQNKIYTGRLLNIDAPEIDQPYGIESRNFLKLLILNKQVTINTSSIDKYNRRLIQIYLANTDINLKLVKFGYAWDYRRYNDNSNYIVAETDARINKLGLWGLPNPINPENWRNSNLRHSIVTCNQLTSCKDALYWYNEKHILSLDRNKNGIPCETLCK